MSRRVLVIGVGNELRRDDGAGVFVSRRVRELCDSVEVTVTEHTSDGADLMELFGSTDAVIVIDAVRSGGEPGRHVELDATVASLPSDYFFYSTHAFGVAEAVEMSRALGTLPRTVIVHGIVGSDFGAGEGCSPSVSSAILIVAKRIAEQATRLAVVSDA